MIGTLALVDPSFSVEQSSSINGEIEACLLQWKLSLQRPVLSLRLG